MRLNRVQRLVIGPCASSLPLPPVIEQTAQPAFEVAACTRTGDDLPVPLDAFAPEIAVGKQHPVAAGEPVENPGGETGAEAFHQSMERRLRLPERALLRFDRAVVAVLKLPDAVATGDPPALDLENIQALGAANGKVDLRESLAGMPGRLQRVIGGVAIVEDGAQSPEDALLRVAARIVGRLRHHAHADVQPPSFPRTFASVSGSSRASSRRSKNRSRSISDAYVGSPGTSM